MNTIQKLIFAITQHEVLGIILEPFIVSVHADGQFFFGLRKVNTGNISGFATETSEAEFKALAVCDEYREDNLVKEFSKKRLTPKDFFKELTAERFNKIIRPYIEKRLVACLDTLAANGTPIYYKGGRKDILKEKSLPVELCKVEVIMNFEKRLDETRYYLSAVCGGENVNLFDESALLITRMPCYAILGNKIYRFQDGFDGNKLLPFFHKEFIAVPERSEKEFFKTFVKNAILDHKIRHSGFFIEYKKEKCKPLLKVETSLEGEMLFALYYAYGKKKIAANFPNSKLVDIIEKDKIELIVIEREMEEEAEIRSLLSAGELIHSSGHFYKPFTGGNDKTNMYQLQEWINKNQEFIHSCEIEVQNEANYFAGRIEMLLNIEEQNDWFDVKAFAHFGELRVPFIRLKKYLLNEIREYPLPNGEIAILPQEWFSKYRETLQLGEKEGEAIRLKKHQYAVVEQLDLSGRQKFKKIFENLKQKKISKNLSLPLGLNATLRPYQEKGFSWLHFLYSNNLGGCLADDMGLGKTIQVLALLLKIKEESQSEFSEKNVSNFQLNLFGGNGSNLPPAHTSLIVMPLSLVHNWESEIKKFAPGLRYWKHTGNNRIQYKNGFYNYDVILATYGIIRNDLELLRQVQFHQIILDESQFVKNPDSKAYQAIRSLKAKHRIVLTGTPVENSLNDLWSQLSFLNPGLLGSLNYFRNEYVIPVEKQNDEAKKESLKQLIEPFILRRTKSLVAKDLPELVEKVHYCEMSQEQKSLYESKKSEIRNRIFEKMEIPGQVGVKIDILQGLMQLRLIANHPGLSQDGIGMESGKFEEVIRNLDNLRAEGHKVLIFSQFVKHLNLFRQWFEFNQLPYSWLTGEITEKERKQVIQNFQKSNDISLFLISLRAGGTGLNLTSADYVFILDPWWNPAVEKQAINRAHRIGQSRNVISYKFITKDSVEEKILLLQQKKEKLAEDFINANNPFRVFSDKEILDLFD
jgi:superfamily II DNA or RNA helicase